MKNIKRLLLGVTSIILLFVFSLNSRIIIATGFTPPENHFVISEKNSQIVPGVMEKEVIYNNATGENPVSGFVVDVNLEAEGVNIMASTTNYDEAGTQTVRQMANAVQRRTGRNVVAGVNADLNWSGTGLSSGVTIVDSKVITDKPSIFFGITNDNKAVIGTASDYSSIKNELKQAVRGMGWLVRDGKATATSTSLAPRTAVGIKADGTVFFYVVEGRAFPRSVGISTKDLAEIMLSYGAVNALNLDGGGSTTYIAKKEGQSNLSVRNYLSDGSERSSISSLLVYYDAEGDGVFERATITSNDDLYTPYSEVEFSAAGLDNAGYPVELPNDLIWELEDESFGMINEGLFQSTGKTGEVIVNLKQGENIVGSSKIEIRKPDQMLFHQEEFNLAFNEENNFGLRLLYEGRDMSFNNQDIEWDFDENLGVMVNGIFKANPDTSIDNKIIRATYIDTDVYVEARINVGLLPLVAWDFEKVNGSNDYWYDFLATSHEIGAAPERGEEVSFSIVDSSAGEPVRFGEQSLRVDFDFTKAQKNTTLSLGVGPEINQVPIDGSPTSIGVWVYATEELEGHWFRSMVYQYNGTEPDGSIKYQTQYLDWQVKREEGEEGGNKINWVGWKYMELDLTVLAKPLAFFRGQTFRLLISNSGKEGSIPMNRGSFYLDNLTYIYGHNPDDVHDPVIDYIKVNDIDVQDSVNLNTNDIRVESMFYDYDNEFSSGIDYNSVQIFINGKGYKDHPNHDLQLMDEDKVYLSNIYLPDGTHNIQVMAVDNAGNNVTRSVIVNINTNSNNKVYFESDDYALLGEKHTLTLKADDISNIDYADLSLRLSKDFETFDESPFFDESFLEFGEGFEGSFEYLNSIQMLNIRVDRKYLNNEPIETNDFIFKINFDVKSNLTINHRLDYSLTKGEYGYINNNNYENIETSFHMEYKRLELQASLRISYDLILVGYEGEFIVLDGNNEPVSNVEIFLTNAQGAKQRSLGFTDGNGVLYTEEFSSETQEFHLLAESEDERSFIIKGQSLSSYGEEDGTPYNIISNGVENPESSKNITWFSNVLADEDAIIEYALTSELSELGETAFNQKNATTKLIGFTGQTNYRDNYAVNINNVVLRGLESGKSYTYRVGNGNVWSENKTFKTVHKNGDVNILLIGDLQTENYDILKDNLNYIANDGVDYDFVLQTGDMIDIGNNFSMWNGALNSLSESDLQHLDMIHALGNHEFLGDVNAEKSEAIYNFPQGGSHKYFSVQYGVVYIASLSHTKDTELVQEFLDWLVVDANESDALWKVMITHEPIYYTNPGGGNGLLNQMAPAYIEQAGLDFVFTGHDHTYTRTQPLLNGVPHEDGVVYMISGALGEKGYNAVDNPDFHFEVMNDQFESVYVSIEANDKTFKITAHDPERDEILDVYTKTKDVEHEHEYTLIGDRLVCDECNYSRALAGYVGFVHNEEGKLMYHLADDFHKGIYFLEDNMYYFDEKGYASIGEVEIMGLTTYFDMNGKFVSGGTGYVYDKGKVYYYVELSKHISYGMTKINGKYHYMSSSGSGEIQTGLYYISHLGGYHLFDDKTGRALTGVNYYKNLKVETNEKGLILSGGTGISYQNEKIYYYENFNIQKTGFINIDGYTYYFSTTTGEARTGKYNGYIFDEYGKMIKGKFVKDHKGIRYDIGYTTNNLESYVTGFQEIDGDIYYFDEDGYLMTGTFEVNGFKVESDENGIIQF